MNIRISVTDGNDTSSTRVMTYSEAIEFLLRVYVAREGESLQSMFARERVKLWNNHLERITE